MSIVRGKVAWGDFRIGRVWELGDRLSVYFNFLLESIETCANQYVAY